VLAFAGIQNALLLTNFNEEATGIVVGGLLLLSVFAPNTREFAARARAALRGRDVRRSGGIRGPRVIQGSGVIPGSGGVPGAVGAPGGPGVPDTTEAPGPQIPTSGGAGG
jgi:hypothetical protein